MFLRKVIRDKKLPFEPEPSDELKKAIKESQEGNIIQFKNTEQLIKTLRK